MRYVEMSIEDAMILCGKSAKVLVAVQKLEKNDTNIVFATKKKEDYPSLFQDVKTVASMFDDFAKQLNLFTEKQDIHNIKPIGVRKIVLIE